MRWVCGVHQAEGHHYLVREKYEELLWWLQMPALLCLAGAASPDRPGVEGLGKSVAAALGAAEAAGYRVDTLPDPLADSVDAETAETPLPEPDSAEPAANATDLEV